ncbi:MAG TPA: glycosyltransferase family 4 protein [Vicinamibacterales bacterium]|jgi:glycosyltransferase involved in cell wall biosynthesis
MGKGRALRVLLAHKFYETRGGAEVFFFETGRTLEQHGHEVAYFATSADPSKADGFRTFLISPPDYERGNFIGRLSQIGRLIYSRSVKEQFAEAIRTFKPDLVHVFGIHVHLTPSILAAAHEAAVPILMSCNDYKHICPNYKLYHHGHICMDCKGGKFYSATVNRCCKDSVTVSVASSVEAYAHDLMGVYDLVHTFLFSSQFMAHETQEFWPNRSFRWRQLRNPFDSTKFRLETAYEDYALFVGRLIEEKGVDVLLDAASLVPSVRVKIVGTGPEEGALRAQAARLELTNVEFLGAVWGDDLDMLLSRSRFLIVPSVWHENYPYVINQSFAFGKPVIASDRGGMPELVDHDRTGLVYDSGDRAALARAMQALWDDPDRTVRLGRAAKEYSDATFNDERFLETLLGIYSEVLDAGVGTGG